MILINLRLLILLGSLILARLFGKRGGALFEPIKLFEPFKLFHPLNQSEVTP
jgi:hypothetical protein